MPGIVSVQKIRQLEADANASGYSYPDMMQNAGRAVALRALQILNGTDSPRITVLVGKGNNGGDGLVAARLLAENSSILVRCYLSAPRVDDPLEAAARAAGVAIANASDDQGYRVLRQMIGSAHLIIDALFGIGLSLPLRGEAARLLQVVNAVVAEMRDSRPASYLTDPARPIRNTSGRRWPYVVAVDCPSGLDCDTGSIDHHTLHADETVTFIAAKPGLLTFPGAGAVGRLLVANIGFPDNLVEPVSDTNLLIDADWVHDRLPPRPVNSHKGTYGKAFIAGGSTAYRGAVGLAASAAYRAGAGLVTVNAPEDVVHSLAGHLLEATWQPWADPASVNMTGYDALLAGPGWGQHPDSRNLLDRILEGQPAIPMVLDADALNLLAELPEWWKRLPPNTILTPHPGEMARLSGLSTTEIQTNRHALALQKAAEWQVILLLKGAHTVIASPDQKIVWEPFKTDALAKAGTGDVLAGVIVGLLAQGLKPFEAAAVGAYLHGLAGELAAEKLRTTRSALARDVVDHLPDAINTVEYRSWVET
jgi:NAD(P)H-hydrate epimerase